MAEMIVVGVFTLVGMFVGGALVLFGMASGMSQAKTKRSDIYKDLKEALDQMATEREYNNLFTGDVK